MKAPHQEQFDKALGAAKRQFDDTTAALLEQFQREYMNFDGLWDYIVSHVDEQGRTVYSFTDEEVQKRWVRERAYPAFQMIGQLRGYMAGIGVRINYIENATMYFH